MENIGALAILLAFCFAIYAVIGSVVGKLRKKPFILETPVDQAGDDRRNLDTLKLLAA